MSKRGSKQDPDDSPRDRRIKAQFKAMKSSNMGVFDGTLSSLYLRLARQWKIPVREVKRIVHGPRMRNVVDIRDTVAKWRRDDTIAR